MSVAQDDRRLDVLMRLIHLGMARSRQALNTTDLVQASYGDDASLFGGTEILVATLEDMLDKMHDQVLGHDLPMHLKQYNIQEILDRFDDVVRTLEQEDARELQREEHDQASATHAIDSSLLPTGVTLENVLDFYKYRNAHVQRDELATTLQQVQDEIAGLEQEYADVTSHVDSQQRILQEAAQALNRSADLCSMVGQ
jgi:hypothetical protein